LQVRQIWVAAAGASVAVGVLFGIIYAELTRRAAAEAVRTAPARLPRVVYSVVEPWVQDGPRSELRRVVLILTPTDLMGADDLVSVLHREELGATEGYEKFVGLGVVQTINRGGQPQVVIFHEARGADEIWDKVRERDRVALDALLVRPGTQFLRLADWRALDE
jgi:hypothetical protein